MTALDRGLQEGVESGYALKADTIEALAVQIGIAPAKLRKTIEVINNYADRKEDPDFNRKPEH